MRFNPILFWTESRPVSSGQGTPLGIRKASDAVTHTSAHGAFLAERISFLLGDVCPLRLRPTTRLSILFHQSFCFGLLTLSLTLAIEAAPFQTLPQGHFPATFRATLHVRTL